MLEYVKSSNKKNEISKNNLSLKEIEKLSIFLSRIFKKNSKFQLKQGYSIEFLNWLYNENPNGPSIINNVYENEKIIAHFALVPITVLFNNKTYKSALSVFTSIDENHRNLYFFHQLASESFELARSEGIRFIMSIASEVGSELYIKCFKFKLIAPLDVKIGWSKFQEKNKSQHKFEVLRDNTTLQWRLRNPRFKYQIFKENEKYIIFNNNYKLFKMNMGYISNINLDLHNKIISNKKWNLNPLNIWMGLNNNLKEEKMSFNFPNVLKPSPSNLIIKDLTSEEINLVREDVKINLIDYEVF